ncbi:uncharacterized protein LOC121873323 [Homarus americanus]|uniref:uncharacterized protein LOC121873323 n=1 Tax=Homarus americanus TaxID=6706 RepID=UPI001C467066|nr:uncharacterized protein LOC121873323 [Homarus americanus]
MRGNTRQSFRPLRDPLRTDSFLDHRASRGSRWGGTRPPRSLGQVMVADQSTNSLSATLTEKEYVALLERQLRDLRARVSACRSCLTPPQRKLATCGGGNAWRDYRRRRRLLRRMEREQRKERRRQERKNKEQMTNNNTSSATPTTTPSNKTTTTSSSTPTTTPSSTTTTTPTITTTDEEALDNESVLADVAYSDQKLDNQRARETHRMSTDFRRGFNQKISRMDEALMQFTDTQAAFCKELRDNLGGRLEKRGQELEALSDQIAALVRTSTAQITALEKVASDQLYSGQASIEKSLAITQAIRDSQLRAIQNYHKQTFLPAAAAIAAILTDQASAATSMGVELITKVEMLQDVYLTYATRQADTLQKLKEDVDKFASKHNNLVMRSRDHANYLHINAHNLVRELQTRMNNVVKELVLIRLQSQNFISINNDTHNDINNSLNKTQDAVETLSQGLKNRLDNATVLEQDFRKIFKRDTNHISDRVERGISQALVSNHASMRQIEEAELDTRVFVGTTTAAWNELYLNQEAELRKEADSLTHSLRTHTHHTQNVLTGMRSAAETHELVLEDQRMNFQRFIRKRQDALDNQCSAITDWAMLMSTELRRRDEDLHRFLSEDLQYTTVTVPEDEDGGYLVSRLPDGSLVYQSSPAHAPAHARSPRPPPNVNYQLDGTAYSPGLASSTSHSSPNKPQLEKTVVTYVNNTRSKFSSSSNNITSAYSSKPSAVHNNSLDKHSETEKFNVPSEVDSEISNNTSSKELQGLGFHHHTKTTKSEGSSLQKIEKTKNGPVRGGTGRKLDTNPDNVAYTQVGTEPGERNDFGEENIIQEIHVLGTEDVQTDYRNEEMKKQTPKILHRRRGELQDAGDRQNDGAYKPVCARTCGSQKGNNETAEKCHHSTGADNLNVYDDDDDDEGIKKLRKILQEAQKTIQKFQMDFQLQGNSKDGNTSRTRETFVTGDVENDIRYNATIGINDNHNTTNNSSKSNYVAGNQPESVGSKKTHEGASKGNTSATHHIRHQHHKNPQISGAPRAKGPFNRHLTSKATSPQSSIPSNTTSDSLNNSTFSISSSDTSNIVDTPLSILPVVRVDNVPSEGSVRKSTVELVQMDQDDSLTRSGVKGSSSVRRGQNRKSKKLRENNETSTTSSVPEHKETKKYGNE